MTNYYFKVCEQLTLIWCWHLSNAHITNKTYKLANAFTLFKELSPRGSFSTFAFNHIEKKTYFIQNSVVVFFVWVFVTQFDRGRESHIFKSSNLQKKTFIKLFLWLGEMANKQSTNSQWPHTFYFWKKITI